MPSPDAVGRPRSPSTNGSGRERRRRRDADATAGDDVPFGRWLPVAVGTAVAATLFARAIATGAGGAAAALDPATLEALGLTAPLRSVAAAGDAAARVGATTAAVGVAYGLASAVAWALLRRT
ncbi:hypothetical protein Hbl1158_11075 [Halobaculum sp. CBA1158]|uniref:hypothetical protein n=1 Tax=Halobaculum sp. CBA1158 TaxID=2904243 RepID=UPI001F232B68|nr:hypothetical protein [Halobaculum sp. CBA1158]UIO99072.1 hypothetical protein Hbl1158_11075 [Halobaculum sp. CBA1158]